MPEFEIEGPRRKSSNAVLIAIGAILVLLLVGARFLASYVIEIAWWKELGQFRTWLSMLFYNVAPLTAATLVAFAVLWLAHARALRFAGTTLRDNRPYARISPPPLPLLAYLISAACIER